MCAWRPAAANWLHAKRVLDGDRQAACSAPRRARGRTGYPARLGDHLTSYGGDLIGTAAAKARRLDWFVVRRHRQLRHRQRALQPPAEVSAPAGADGPLRCKAPRPSRPTGRAWPGRSRGLFVGEPLAAPFAPPTAGIALKASRDSALKRLPRPPRLSARRLHSVAGIGACDIVACRHQTGRNGGRRSVQARRAAEGGPLLGQRSAAQRAGSGARCPVREGLFVPAAARPSARRIQAPLPPRPVRTADDKGKDAPALHPGHHGRRRTAPAPAVLRSGPSSAQARLAHRGSCRYTVTMGS